MRISQSFSSVGVFRSHNCVMKKKKEKKKQCEAREKESEKECEMWREGIY